MTLRVELLIIGNEILSGHTLDTNSQWLAQQLQDLDLPVGQIVVIEDEITHIASAIKASLERNTTLLIICGGLGPTFDDLTAQGLAVASGTSLESHPKALEMVTNRYKVLKSQGLVESSKMTPARKKMAKLPRGAIPLPNSVGTAPGIYLQIHNTHVFCLPGVPQELYAVFKDNVAPQITKFTEKVIIQQTIEVPILDESVLAPLIDGLMKNAKDVYLKSLPRPYQSRTPLRVAVTATAPSQEQADTLLSQTIITLKEITESHRQI